MKSIQNTDHWLKQQALGIPDRIALINDKQKVSYSGLYEIVNKSGSYLYAKGIRKKNHVAVILNNTLEFIAAINALWIIGAIPVPINIRLNKDEKLKLIKHADCKYTISDGAFIKKVNNSIDFSIKEIPNLDKTFIDCDYSPENIALMMYSSGSTGNPKCVKISFNNLYESFTASDTFIKHSIDSIWLASLPFYHIGGFSIFTRSLISGCKLVLSESFTAKVLEKNIKLNRPTYLSLVPTMLIDFINRKIKPWKELKFVFLGGGPVSKNEIENAIKLGWPIVTVYGSTETTSMVTASSPEDLTVNSISAGKAFPGVEIKLLDNDGKSVNQNEAGEIIIRSKSIAEGYYKASENYMNKIKNGVYYSRDLGRIDEKGNLHILGRMDDIIISGGENISLNEIENIVKQIDFIKDCSTLITADKKWGQSYILFAAAGKDINEEDVKNHLSNKIGKYKFPQKILILSSIPRNELGKVDKTGLSKIAAKHSF